MVSSFENYNSKEGWPGVSALLGAAASCDIWSPRGAVLYTLVYANTNTEIHKYELLRIHLATAKAQFVFTNFIKSIFSLSLKHTHAALHWYYNVFEMWPPLVMQGTIIYNGDTAQTPRLARPLTPVWGNVRLICNQ